MTLVPLRIDVSSGATGTRIVDTILFDPSCWPIPLVGDNAVERNVQELAYGLISDAEVIGMGRTIRHFTGRVDLYTKVLHDLVADQLRPQLLKVFDDMSRKRTNASGVRTIHLHLNTHGVIIQDSFDWDPSIDVSPITFAEQMVSDLNLPEEASVAIATAILEQLHGLEMPSNLQQVTCTELDPKEHANTLANVVGFYR
jgi:hypothetical protein